MVRGPQNPLKCPKRGFGGPKPPPKNIFFAIFQGFVNFLGLSAFQRAFTFYLTLTFSRFMMFLRKFGFLVENLGISYGKICAKIAKFKVRFWEAKNDFIKKLKKTICLEIWFYKGKMLSRLLKMIFRGFILWTLYPNVEYQIQWLTHPSSVGYSDIIKMRKKTVGKAFFLCKTKFEDTLFSSTF